MGQIKLDTADVRTYGEISYIPQLENIEIENIEDKSVLGKLNVHNLAGENLSGGEETKLKIAKAFSENNDVIFADEPTCNLDNESIEYITNTLKYYSGSVVVISHDRYFQMKLSIRYGKLKMEKSKNTGEIIRTIQNKKNWKIRHN